MGDIFKVEFGRFRHLAGSEANSGSALLRLNKPLAPWLECIALGFYKD